MVTEADLRMQNPWWADGSWEAKDPKIAAWRGSSVKHDPRLRHQIEYDSEPSNTMVYTMRGPRQVGKTTMIKMQIRDMLAAGTCPWNVLYCSFDLAGAPQEIVDTVKEYFELSRRHRGKRRSYLFLDEISSVPNWQKGVKWLVDVGLLFNCTVLATGSASVDVRKATELMPGRRGRVRGGHDRTLLPMGFGEFACLLDEDVAAVVGDGARRDGLLSDLLAGRIGETADRLWEHRVALDRLLKEYAVTGGIPRVVDEKVSSGRVSEDTYGEYAGGVIGQWRQLSRSEASLKQLVGAAAQSTGSQTSWNAIAKAAALSGAGVASEYVHTLRDMFVLHVIYRYGDAAGAPMIKSDKKAYFCDPFMFHALRGWSRSSRAFEESLRYVGDETGMGRVVEAAACDCLARLASRSAGGAAPDYSDRLFYWRDEMGRELDFVLRAGRSAVPVEVKFQNTFSRRDLAPVVRFLDAASAEKGIVVSKSELEERSDYAVVPACIFLLGA